MQLNEICELIIDCEHKTAPTQESGHPSIRTPNIGRGYFILENVNRVSQETYEQWTKRAIPQAGDLIMAREAPVGNVALIPEGLKPCLGQRTLLIRPDKNKVNPAYLTYLLIGPDVQGLIHSKTNGATVAHLNMKDVRQLELPKLPDRKNQDEIAEILSAYDSLIENNNRRIAILENMAQSLYREWFINFRFPGCENCTFADSVLGRVPEGWGVKPVSAVIHIDPATKVPKEGKKPFVPMSGLSESLMLIDDIEYRVGNSGSKFRNGDTLFARITPCLQNGKTGFVHFLNEENPVGFGSTEFIVLRSNTVCPEYVYCMARTQAFRDNAIKSMSGATGRQRVRNECFNSLLVAEPANEVLNQFSQIAESIFEQVYVFHRKIVNLKAQRDMLLPRLVSGQIELDKQ